MKPISDARTYKDACKYLQRQMLNEGFSRKRLRERFITFASAVANVILGGRMYLRLKQTKLVLADAVHCKGGCSALRGRLQCTASEMGKTGTEIVSPILDKRKGR